MKAPPRFLVCGSSSRGARPSSNSLASALPMRPSIQCRLPVTRGARRRPSARSTAVGPGGVRPRTRRPSGLVASVRVLGGRRGAAVASAAGPGPRRRARSGGSSIAAAPPGAPPVGPTAPPNLVEAPRRPRRPAASVRTLDGRRGAAVASAAALSTRGAARGRAAVRSPPRPPTRLRPARRFTPTTRGFPIARGAHRLHRSAAVGTRPSRRASAAARAALAGRVMMVKTLGCYYSLSGWLTPVE